MPENPLLPNRKLQQLYAGMLRARELSSARPAGLEAIVASVAQQLEAGDVVLPFAHTGPFGALLHPGKRSAPSAAVLAPSASPLAFAAGLAAGTQLAGAGRLVVALLDPRHPEPNWPALLGHIQQDRLPLIVICPELSGAPMAESDALSWPSLSRVVRKLRFPVLTVDGADAVAMYRAMQESVLRARHGDGPALLWCLMPLPGPRNGRVPAQDASRLPPLARLESYLNARRIALPGVPAGKVRKANGRAAAGKHGVRSPR